MFATVSIERPASVPFLPWTRVRMKMIRSPFLPEIRGQSSGFVALGSTNFSRNSMLPVASNCHVYTTERGGR